MCIFNNKCIMYVGKYIVLKFKKKYKVINNFRVIKVCTCYILIRMYILEIEVISQNLTYRENLTHISYCKAGEKAFLRLIEVPLFIILVILYN